MLGPEAARLGVRRAWRGPTVRDRRPPRSIAAVERDGKAVIDDPQPLADGLEEPSVVADDEDRRRRRPEEGLDRLAGRDVEVVRRLVEEQQVRRQDAEQGELEPRALATRERPDLLERVVTPEQEPRQVRPRLARRDRQDIEERVEDGRAGMRLARSWAR